MAKLDKKTEKKKELKSEEELTWKDIEVGAICTEPGSASQYQTGDWRSRRPVFDPAQCSKCGLCQVYCPEGCVMKTEKGTYEPNLFYCKGCGICARECPKKAITMEEEKE